MDLNDKLNLLDLNEKEKSKAIPKAFPTISLCSIKEIAQKMDLLHRNGLKIEKFKDIKVICEEFENLKRRLEKAQSINELGLYKEDLSRLIKDETSIFMKIGYCTEHSISYKDEKGKYKKFLFDEKLWQKEIDKKEEKNMISSPEVEVETNEYNDEVSDIHHININEPDYEEVDYKHIENDINNDMQSLDNNVINFQDMKAQLERELATLDALRADNSNTYDEQNDFDNNNINDDLISFDDWNFEEEKGMKRSA